MKYSTLLSVTEYDGYAVAEIKNPWKPGKLLHRYVLVPKNHGDRLIDSDQNQKPVPVIPDYPEGTVIEVPIERAAVFTTVRC